jgi:multimeric flavodoxin WrbA
MKVIAVNGSPRKEWNTAILLQSALDGAASRGADTKLVHLYDLDYKGCYSCFACKLKGGRSYGKCAAGDELKPVLDEIAEADALVLGSPIYFGTVTGQMRSFFERLAFPYAEYSPQHPSLYRGSLRKTAWIATMNVPEQVLGEYGYDATFGALEDIMRRVFGHCEWLSATDTLQFEDYSKYVSSLFDPVSKKRRHETVFPEVRKKAFDMGARFAGE